MPKNSMGEFLAALRKSHGYTQQEVAEKLGVSNKTVSSWETGASCPDIALLPAIAELFGVTCDELLRGERIPAGESAPDAKRKREKALAFLSAKYRNSASVAAIVSCGQLSRPVSLGRNRRPGGVYRLLCRGDGGLRFPPSEIQEEKRRLTEGKGDRSENPARRNPAPDKIAPSRLFKGGTEFFSFRKNAPGTIPRPEFPSARRCRKRSP